LDANSVSTAILPSGIGWLLAAVPLIVVLVLMLRFRWGGAQAGAMGWLVAQVVAAGAFGATPILLAYAQPKGLLLTFYVLYIIWGALVFFRVTDEAGSVRSIGTWLPQLTPDRPLQVLLLGWVFSSFLQGFGGFGVPVAVTAPLLVGLGFTPVSAVVIASIGHSWAVTFGSLGSAFYALMAAATRPAAELALPAALLLGPTCMVCGAAALLAAGGFRLLRSGLAPLLCIGSAMAAVQFIVAVGGQAPLASMIAGLAGLVVAVLWARYSRAMLHGDAQIGRVAHGQPGAALPGEVAQNAQAMPIGWALAPYVLLIIVVLSASLIEPLSSFLGQVVILVRFPELATSQGWVTPAQTGRTIDVFGHPGALLLYSSVLAYLLLNRLGYYRPGAPQRIARSVLKGAWRSSLGVAAMVGMATAMEHAGMTHLLADGIARMAGTAFPLASPFIGALGAFMTGSNTNSNVIFASLQQSVAALVGVNPLVILAAQTAGGSIGSMFAPAKIIVACSTVSLGGKESQALGATMRFGLAIVGFLALLTAIAARVAAG
jgi:lactate permease